MSEEIYIHIPYCQSRCSYCVFHSTTSNSIPDSFITEMILDIKGYREKLSNIDIDIGDISSIFMGGGSPSLLSSDQLKRIIDAISSYIYPVDSMSQEITIELNPSDITEPLLIYYKTIGINRISIGGQSLRDEVLKWMNRRHTSRELLSSISLCKKHFDNISVDFIYGYEGQGIDGWKEELKEILSLDIPHLSLYELSIEQKSSPFIRSKKLSTVGSEDIFSATIETMSSSTYDRYEVSNFAKGGLHCRHNEAIWRGGVYHNFGASSCGRLRDRSGSWLESKVEENSNNRIIKKLSDKDRLLEFLITGFRLSSGINRDLLGGKSLSNFFSIEFLQKHKSYFFENVSHIGLTPSGLDMLDYILRNLVLSD
ncbi:MAG: radical SAM family heme chaperone HemW [Alphaproteobacteria bacterium]|nr:radical SAM family heme chaperone HemW [Alphaproteobacteria bacterium]MBL0717826.1 radical SAM family heme chaperone HemW [Alphaproteobacteria bacterium]